MVLAKALNECMGGKYIHVECGGDFCFEKKGSTLKIFFEWSDGSEDWKSNFNFLATPCKPYKGMARVWLCHRGFLKVWKAIEPYLKEHICDPNIRKIEIVGYSHGAAIALLCYEYCVFNCPNVDVEGAGFGCPRVFWGFVPSSIKTRFDNFKVIRNGNDIVTHVPPAIFGFRHVGEIVHLSGSEDPIKDHYSQEYAAKLKDTECQ